MLNINQENHIIEMKNKILEIDFKDKYDALTLDGYNDGNLPIMYYDLDYEINRINGEITIVNSNTKADYSTFLAIYNLFVFSKKKPKNSNIFMPIHQLKKAANHAQSFKNHALVPFAKKFDGKTDLLLKAGETLGFTPIKTSDVGFIAYPFKCIPIQFLFWDGDDEFPAQSNILFDENITDFISEESVLTIAMDGVKKLIDTAGLL